jgi:single-strand selective monofunctional uracil DNA glycosylase
MKLITLFQQLSDNIQSLTFSEPVTHVYNPLVYARKPLERYIRDFGQGQKEILLLGMNPGPFGMAQTGVPFGDVRMVRDWIGIDEPVGKPEHEHAKRPILGFDCPRSEVSGTRLWGWAQQRFKTPERFFSRFFVYNFCPLIFLEASGRNRTPDKLPMAERKPLIEACNHTLRRVVEEMKPTYVIGIGGFAEKQAQEALAGIQSITIGRIPHPSPANPAANKGWAEAAEKAIAAYSLSF